MDCKIHAPFERLPHLKFSSPNLTRIKLGLDKFGPGFGSRNADTDSSQQLFTLRLNRPREVSLPTKLNRSASQRATGQAGMVLGYKLPSLLLGTLRFEFASKFDVPMDSHSIWLRHFVCACMCVYC